MGIIILSSVGESCSEPHLSARQSARRGRSRCIHVLACIPERSGFGKRCTASREGRAGQRRTAPATSKDAGVRNARPQRRAGNIVLVQSHDAQGMAGAYPAESHAERVTFCPTACPEEAFHPPGPAFFATPRDDPRDPPSQTDRAGALSGGESYSSFGGWEGCGDCWEEGAP